MTAIDTAGNKTVFCAATAFVGRYPRGPVVRIQGIDAGFGRPSYAPGQVARIHIATDESAFTLQVFHVGPEKVVTYADNQLAGVAVDIPKVTADWSNWTSKPHSIMFRIPDVPSGLYYVLFTGA